MATKTTQLEKDLNALIVKKARLVARETILKEKLLFIQEHIALTDEGIRGVRKDVGNAQGTQLTARERQMVANRDWLMAIKAVRERTSLGLKEAKDIVDAYRNSIGQVSA